LSASVSNRFSSPQPNVPGKGIVAGYGAGSWILVCVIGIAAGLAGAALMEALKALEHLAWSFSLGHLLVHSWGGDCADKFRVGWTGQPGRRRWTDARRAS
jgi:hypothetical protein